MTLKCTNPLLARLLLLLLSFGILLMIACGDSSSTDDSNPTDDNGPTNEARSGTVSFNLVDDRVESDAPETEAVIDCGATGILTIAAKIYDGNGGVQAESNWQCMDHRETVDNVPVGSGLTVEIVAKDAQGIIILRGTQSGVQVQADRTTDAGNIRCRSFAPRPMAPGDKAEVNVDAMGLAWHPVPGAVKYRLMVSTNSDMKDPIIDKDDITLPNDTPAAGKLADGGTYYWQAIAFDQYGYPGGKSPVSAFTVNAAHINNPPTAQIASPINDSAYTTNDPIHFSVNSKDMEDGDLSSTALTWYSDIDGVIGTGRSFSTYTLSTGTHLVTLTAIDTDGATGIADVEITIQPSDTNTSPTAQITNPITNSIFPQGETITFDGSASDAQDGDLIGASLVWRSDVDDLIGHGRTFTADALRSGTHRITLTATDADGATGMDETVITIQDAKPIKVLFAIDCSNSMVETDPLHKRVAAALAFVNHYNAIPNISFELLLWNSTVIGATQANGFRGFTKKTEEFERVLQNIENNSWTDYLATIAAIRTDIERDIQDTAPETRAQTKYIVVFLSDGLDRVENEDGPRTDQILTAIEDLHTMAVEENKVGKLAFHTVLLIHPSWPDRTRRFVIDVLQKMAEKGNGEFIREYNNADDIDFVNSVDMQW